jgi:hypothetical protein
VIGAAGLTADQPGGPTAASLKTNRKKGPLMSRENFFIREKFTRLRTTARKIAAEYFERYPKDRYMTEIESWHDLQSDNIEFTIKRLREPIDNVG